MNDIEANAVADGSWHNRPGLAPGTECGCFHCQATFAADEIRQWIDNDLTALCPRCGVDTVLPNVTDASALRDLHDRRFRQSSEPSDADWGGATSTPDRVASR